MRAPSEELLEHCSSEHFLRISEHFVLEVDDNRVKEIIKDIIKANLIKSGVVRSKRLTTSAGHGFDAYRVPRPG